jgi:hypothetical protein
MMFIEGKKVNKVEGVPVQRPLTKDVEASVETERTET